MPQESVGGIFNKFFKDSYHTKGFPDLRDSYIRQAVALLAKAIRGRKINRKNIDRDNPMGIHEYHIINNTIENIAKWVEGK